ALGRDAPDLDDGGHPPAAAVPRPRRAKSAGARRAHGRVGLPALPPRDQRLRAAHRLRRPPHVRGCRRRRQLHPGAAAPGGRGARRRHRVPRRLLRRDGHDRRGLPRALEDDLQRHRPTVPPPPPAAGPLGIGWLRPTALFSLEGLDSMSHGVFWSLFVNVAAYLLVSIFTAQDADERSQAAAFVGLVEKAEPSPTPAILSVPEIERLLHLYVPAEDADAILGELLGGKTPRDLSLPDLLDLRIRLERMLAASLGAAAARYIIEDRFTISKGDAQELVESFQTMQRSLGKSERLLASVVESVEDCIFTTDVEGRLITLNPAGRRLLGRDAAAGALTRLDVL